MIKLLVKYQNTDDELLTLNVNSFKECTLEQIQGVQQFYE